MFKLNPRVLKSSSVGQQWRNASTLLVVEHDGKKVNPAVLNTVTAAQALGKVQIQTIENLNYHLWDPSTVISNV